MKKPLSRLLIAFLTIYLSATLLPPVLYAAVPGPEPSAPPEQEPSVPQGPSESALPSPSPPPASEGQFTLRDTSTAQAFTVDEREFIISDLACEMDPNAPEEALKAQAVAAYTYYSREREQGGEIACDSASWQVYVPKELMQERWGEDYEGYRAVLERVTDAVLGQRLTYNGELALTPYFAISPGSTESVQNVWAGDADREHPYLQAVASPGDAFSDGYLSRAEFTIEELESLLGVSGIESTSPFTEAQYTPSGLVKSVKAGGEEFSGTELRAALGLRSACFSWEPTDSGVRLTVRGWGHGVGLSQAGAVFLAKRGAGYEEILAHYYPGTELRK